MFCPYCRVEVKNILEKCSSCNAPIKMPLPNSEFDCNNCGSKVLEDASYCHHCGKSLMKPDEEVTAMDNLKKKEAIIIGVVIIGFLGLLMLYFFYSITMLGVFAGVISLYILIILLIYRTKPEIINCPFCRNLISVDELECPFCHKNLT